MRINSCGNSFRVDDSKFDKKVFELKIASRGNMQYPKISYMGWQEMAKWKYCLSRVLFSDKGFTGQKRAPSYFLEIFNV